MMMTNKTSMRVVSSTLRQLRRFWKQALAAVMVMGLLVPAPVPAHFDKPGPPPIEVTVTLERLFLLDDLDDGVDGNADLLGFVVVRHEGHEERGRAIEAQYDFDLVGTNGLPFDAVLYTHQECSPRNPLAVQVNLIEVDTDTADLLALGAFSFVRSLVVAAVGGPVTTALAIGSGVVTLIAAALNGNDDLGTTSAAAPENGQLFLDLGGQGAAEIPSS